ncbi:MAG: AAA family ATPase [Saprospiraceae bacterium]|nr:AAA family ATPase [Saprospiraceae bacterium]HMW37966.1 AAA family ATPase [Saprospiraceae bacterium]HMX87640.1 AAA family ATPase [Saprospiraceae bacterium]HMZ39455.1 AAA family ATPase [Saprospiraceae bacterium]HNA63241.1 AAA family ATPase [Saprospiraceae bacterium]
MEYNRGYINENKDIQRPPAEITFYEELKALSISDKQKKPGTWKLSPWAVLKYIMGGEISGGITISPKYIGNQKVVEIAIASLLSDRALLLTGFPGTAKTWLAEHLAAAISGDSTLLIQGTSGTHEDLLKYGWNYASLISKGPTEEGLIPSPVMLAMQQGSIARIEELSRIPTETQDALLSILSEKTVSIPELRKLIPAQQGFNIIATSNDLDKGVYEMSSALRRRFNIVYMPLPTSVQEEIEIVTYRVNQLGRNLNIPLAEVKEKQVQKLVTLLRELRNGITEDGKTKLRKSGASLNPAVSINIIHEARILAQFFDNGEVKPQHMIANLINSIRHDSPEDAAVIQEYNETVLKKRDDYKEWYQAIKKEI